MPALSHFAVTATVVSNTGITVSRAPTPTSEHRLDVEELTSGRPADGPDLTTPRPAKTGSDVALDVWLTHVLAD